jgi:Transport and Golgi organisation 2
MCFVTYLPYEEGFILTSNRDEHAGRPAALPPKRYDINGQTVFFPKDGLAGGTWVASSSRFTLCLLNGATHKHEPRPPYRRSRGLMVLDFFKENNVKQFIESYLFEGIEAFTLVVIEQKKWPTLYQLRWDGAQLDVQQLDASASHAWSSVTLYNDQVIAERQRWFAAFQQTHPQLSAEEIIDFHLNGGKGDPFNDLVISRKDELKTVSVTQVQHQGPLFLLSYLDRLNGQGYRYRIL